MPRNSPGRHPPTRRDRAREIRLTDELVEKLDAWAHSQEDKPDRSEAIRRLLEIALVILLAQPRPAGKIDCRSSRDRAKQLASDVIDQLGDVGATSEVKANRKGKLMKGPEEFRKVRRDRPDR